MEDLKYKLQNLPLVPGCYLMKDKRGTIIYVGKAKKLKSRVNQYFAGAHDFKTTKLVSQIIDFDFIVTDTEKEALLLEINLIKKYRPRFNIMFMDDKSYPYIKLTKENYPRLQVVREVKDKKSRYYGPFPDASAAHQALKLLQTIYPLRRCNTMPKKVCLYYHLGQCLGPCEFQVDAQVYEDYELQIHRFFNGEVRELICDLENKMRLATENLEYEKAINYRDCIKSIHHIIDKQQVQFEGCQNSDVFAYVVDKGYLSIQGFFLRAGQLLEKELSVSPLYGDHEEEFLSFLLQYYQKHPIPKEILLPEIKGSDLLKDALNVKISHPKRGKLKKLIDMATTNAERQLRLKFDIVESKIQNDEAIMRDFSKLIQTDVERIEIFDNSHISGSFTVAACVVYDSGKPNKSEYRTYRLHTKNNDVESMKEVLYRRYFKLLSTNSRFPECILVDGGFPQVLAAQEVLDLLQLSIPLYGLVKDERHQTANLMNNQGELLEIDKNSPLFFLLVRMQDEVHRFALTYHQKLRRKGQTKSILDEIDGIGEVRKKKLLKEFGGINQLKKATLEDLSKVVPEKVAEKMVLLFKDLDSK